MWADASPNGHSRVVARRAVVVGGGIGGLATGVALSGAGWSVRVLERRDDPAAEGSGLSVWPNALRALDALGVGDAVRARGAVSAAGGIRDRRGRWLVRTDAAALEARHGDGIVVLPRADLLTVLRDALPADVLATGTTVEGSTVADLPDADLVVGADGIGSTVRGLVRPMARVRSTGTVAWRLVASVDDPPSDGGETWGDGAYAGVAPLPGDRGRVYLWCVTPIAGGPSDLDGLRRRFAGWHDPIPALLGRVDPDAVVRTELSWLPPLPSFVSGRVALLGDAAHAMTPNLGQGACLALEDAATLGRCLGDGVPVAAGLARYDALRRPRTARLTRMSRTAGLVAGLHGRVPTAVRDTLARSTPTALTLRGLDGVLGWEVAAPREHKSG